MAIERKPVIAIVGAGKCSKKLRDKAAAVARHVVKGGGVVICGGMDGIMEGAARGAWEGGGISIGVLPTEDKNDANKFITIPLPTGFGEARNLIVIRAADAVVAFPGKYGTLSEMAFALKIGKPLVSIAAWKLGDAIIEIEDAQEAAEKALELAKAAMG